MLKKIAKLLYLITRGTSIFSLPGIRNLRMYAYRSFFDAQNLFVGESVLIVAAHYDSEASVNFGKDVKIGSGSLLDYSGKLILEDHCTISEGVKIYTHTHVINEDTLDIHALKVQRNKLVIGEYAWIGANALILPSVSKIGKGAIIGAGSVVTKNVEPLTIVAGNPAKPIGKRAYKGLD